MRRVRAGPARFPPRPNMVRGVGVGADVGAASVASAAVVAVPPVPAAAACCAGCLQPIVMGGYGDDGRLRLDVSKDGVEPRS